MQKKLGNILNEARTARGWSLVEAGEKLGISKSQVHNLEQGYIARPKMELLEKIASVYGLPYDEVVIMGGRLPKDVYYKIVYNPELIKLIRDLKV